jgi:hypothetical protein
VSDGLEQLRHLARLDLRGVVPSARYIEQSDRPINSLAQYRQLTQLQLSNGCSWVDQASCVVLLRSLTRLIDLTLATETQSHLLLSALREIDEPIALTTLHVAMLVPREWNSTFFTEHIPMLMNLTDLTIKIASLERNTRALVGCMASSNVLPQLQRIDCLRPRSIHFRWERGQPMDETSLKAFKSPEAALHHSERPLTFPPPPSSPPGIPAPAMEQIRMMPSSTASTGPLIHSTPSGHATR